MNCANCGKDTINLLVCEPCRLNLTRYQIQKMDRIFQRTAIELGGNTCADCGKSAETDSGELAADHLSTKASAPELRYDLTNVAIRCCSCHVARHAGLISPIPSHKSMSDKKKPKRKKAPLCKKCNMLLAVPAFGGLCLRCKK